MRTVRNSSRLFSGGVSTHPPGAGTPLGAGTPRSRPPAAMHAGIAPPPHLWTESQTRVKT